MTNYIYENINLLTIDDDLYEIFKNQENFTQSFELLEELDYSIEPDFIFFKVVNHENILMGYIWFEHQVTELGFHGNLDEIEISIARSQSLASKDIDRKLFIDKVFWDLAHIYTLLSKSWFIHPRQIWASRVEVDECNKDESYQRGKSHIKQKLLSHGFQHNSTYNIYEKSIV